MNFSPGTTSRHTASRSSGKCDREYEIKSAYPTGWSQDSRGPFFFYAAGAYNDLRGFHFINERTAREQFLWEHTSEQIEQNPVEESETGVQELQARGAKKNLTLFVNDLDKALSGPLDRQTLPMRLVGRR